MKKNYTVTLEEITWQQLEEIAIKKNLAYRGRPSRSEVIERLVAAYAKKEQPVDSKAQTTTVEDETPAVQTIRPVRAVPKPDKKK